MKTFDVLQAGSLLGEHRFVFDEAALGEWTTLFPEDAGCPVMPPAMLAMVVMRAFISIMRDRPPGNVHAGQQFELLRLPVLNERLVTRLRCQSKDLRNGRRWVTFNSETSDDGGELRFSGVMTTLWAA
ncbi:MAG: hypothetical protein GEU91_20940 [Rhizobiales bacterium]|nr:hypothetical protein [Hyphomicrobiales bacterium]